MFNDDPSVLPIREPEPDAALTLAIYCSCGAKLVGKTNRAELADAVMRLFNRMHYGDGHAPLTPERRSRLPKRPWRTV
jgi:hypothetical protein